MLDRTKLQEMEAAGVKNNGNSGPSGDCPRFSTGQAVVTFGIVCCAIALAVVLAVATAASM
ncbi:MAG: hypothetical protein M3453_18610 [Pseudomonadota bacterium]|nr:hypothetical protein [Pseudomonadota bacterium]